MFAWIVGGAFAIGASVLAYSIVLFNVKRIHIIQRAAAATPDQLKRLYILVEAVGSLPSTGCVLARSNITHSGSRSLISLPHSIDGFPWSGRSVEVLNSGGVELLLSHDASGSSAGVVILNSHVFIPVRIPRERTRKGKLRNIIAPSRYFAMSGALQTALSEICPKYPQKLLSYLLCVGRDSFEFDPIGQARIGDRASWIQRNETPDCPHCQKPMQLIVQLPGLSIGGDANPNSTYYLLGCKVHLDTTSLISQRT